MKNNFMGLLFKRGNQFKKRIADSQISNKYIREVAKEVSSKFAPGKSGAKKRFRGRLIDAQRGGLTREEVHGIIRSGVSAGDLTRKKGKELAVDLGLTEQRFRKFDTSRNNMPERGNNVEKKQKKAKSTAKKEVRPGSFRVSVNIPKKMSPNEKARPPLNLASQRGLLVKTENKEVKKPSTIWEILNKQKHPDAFPDDHTDDLEETV